MLPLRAEKPEQEKTLVSWKEIASFLNRAERTVRRWERERGLPVHRVPGGERGGIFAYPTELTTWLLGEQGKAAQSGSDIEADSAHEDGPSIPVEISVAGQSNAPASPNIGDERAHATLTSAGSRRWIARLALSAIGLAIAAAILLALRLNHKTTAARESGSEKSPIHAASSRAEELYLQGRYEWSLRTAASLRKSIDAYTQAIVQDPAYPQAYAGLAESYDLLPEYEGLDRNEAFLRAKAAADRAIELDPNLAAGHRAKAFALFYGDWDAPGSDAEFRKALALAPNEVETHHWYATTLYSRREDADALAEIDRALQLSPTNPAIAADAAFLHVSIGNKVEANVRALRELAQTQPNLVKASRYLNGFDFGHADYETYLVDLRNSATISHSPSEVALADAAERGWTHGGVHGLLIAMRNAELAAFAQGDNNAFDIAQVYLRLGDAQSALRYLNIAFEKHDLRVTRLQLCPCVAEFEKDPAYRALLIRIDGRLHQNALPPLHLAVAAEPGKLPVTSSERQ